MLDAPNLDPKEYTDAYIRALLIRYTKFCPMKIECRSHEEMANRPSFPTRKTYLVNRSWDYLRKLPEFFELPDYTKPYESNEKFIVFWCLDAKKYLVVSVDCIADFKFIAYEGTRYFA